MHVWTHREMESECKTGWGLRVQGHMTLKGYQLTEMLLTCNLRGSKPPKSSLGIMEEMTWECTRKDSLLFLVTGLLRKTKTLPNNPAMTILNVSATNCFETYVASAGQTMLSMELVCSGQLATSCIKTKLELFFFSRVSILALRTHTFVPVCTCVSEIGC